MDFTAYQPEDFAADSSFRQWVRQPDDVSNAYWARFLAEHPEKRQIVAEAIELVRTFAAATDALAPPADPAAQRATWNAIQNRISVVQQPPQYSARRRIYGGGWQWVAAASVATGLALGWWQYTSHNSAKSDRVPEQGVGQTTTPALVERTNSGRKPVLVVLPDGSSLLLKKGSTVRFARQFTNSARVVDLTGEAFFEVVKDPSHPFLVRTSRFITKVLGTSFMVRAYAADQDAVVTVRTGRVSVFATSDQQQQQQRDTPLLNGTVLSKNQQIVFVRHRNGTPDHLSPKRSELTPASNRQLFAFIPNRFVFRDAPVSEVFLQLEKMYGLHIRYSRETLGTCRLTADLTDEPLSEKMLIICKSIEATYTMDGTELTLTGPGCHP